MHYQVKFKKDGDSWNYGIFNGIDNGIACIADAVFPINHEVNESELVDIPYNNFNSGKDEYGIYLETKFEEAENMSLALPVDKLRVGHLFAVSVADGYAYYVVTKVNKKTCSIEWRGFDLDNWIDQRYSWEKKNVNKDEILKFIVSYRSRQDIFN